MMHTTAFILLLVPSVIYGQGGCPLQCALDLQIIQDISCSIQTPNKFLVQDFLKAFVQELSPCIGRGDDKTQIGMISYDKFTYANFYLNRYQSGAQIINAIDTMDWNHDNSNVGGRCGTATYKALNDARTVGLTEAKGVRDPLGIKSPPIKKVVIVLTDGATHPKEKSRDTLEAARALKEESGVTSLVIELPNEKMNNNPEMQARGTKEFTAIATSPETQLRVTAFENLLARMEEIFDGLCIEPTKPPTEEPKDPCQRFASFRRECEITMAMCNPADPRCCGCPLMFKDPVTKLDKTPFEVAYKQGNCLCEDCIRRSHFCLPKAFRPILSYGKPKVSRYYPGAPGKPPKNRNGP